MIRSTASQQPAVRFPSRPFHTRTLFVSGCERVNAYDINKSEAEKSTSPWTAVKGHY
jgi:hypothetical protein